MSAISSLLGPRVPRRELARRGARYLAPSIAFSIARVMLLVSIFLPYWAMDLKAPQYPDGLAVEAYINRLEGDVREIDSLNHYIGMRPLQDAAKLERAISVYGIILLVLLVEAAGYVHTRWALLLVIPAVTFPAFFLIDLHFWLSDFGQNLDPTASMSNSVEPFTPPVLGSGLIGQFETRAWMGPGLILAWLAAGFIVAGLWLHRRAYKPLADGVPEEVAS
ncbi:MAG: cytochrome C [Phycisphaeraceae bacterium]|nr:cytochrome C [Phycisphaerae bacterium]MCP4014032.1 cytochrome C [Phycisphaeraceae bacterium]MCP4497820.1 cytochrome C [Phycisphaeraceae bacterium]MCP4939225.1 cytochrome C [Phycisphaeraceae bacterium]